MEGRERLKFYKKLLFKYKISLYLPSLKKWLHTDNGLCLAIWPKGLSFELYAQKPKQPYGRTAYWYKPGDLKPRIEAIESAIKLCKHNIKIGKFTEKHGN